MTVTAPPAPPAPPSAPTPRADGHHPLRRLAAWSIRHRALAIVLWLVLVAGAVVAGGTTGTRMLTDGEAGSGQSARADLALERSAFPATFEERVLIREPGGGVVPAARAERAVAQLRDAFGRLAEVEAVGDPVTSRDRRAVMLPLTLDTDGATQVRAGELGAERVRAVLAATERVAAANPGW